MEHGLFLIYSVMKNLFKVIKNIILKRPMEEEMIVIELKLVDIVALLCIIALFVRLLFWVF